MTSATTIPGGKATAGHRSAAAESNSAFVALRDDTCATLEQLDAAAKGRASIVRSCTELKDISDAERESLKDLLRCITEHRKRLRAVRRLWKSLDAYERPSTSLVDATQLCLREAREMAVALDPWRMHTIGNVTQSVTVTWSRLVRAAQRFGGDRLAAAPDPGHYEAGVYTA